MSETMTYGRFRHLPATERHSLIIAAGHISAYVAVTAAYVPLSAAAPAESTGSPTSTP